MTENEAESQSNAPLFLSLNCSLILFVALLTELNVGTIQIDAPSYENVNSFLNTQREGKKNGI